MLSIIIVVIIIIPPYFHALTMMGLTPGRTRKISGALIICIVPLLTAYAFGMMVGASQSQACSGRENMKTGDLLESSTC